MTGPGFVQELREAVQVLQAAKTREYVGRAYEALVGYDSAEDDKTASMHAVGSLMLDFICEACYQSGIHVSSIGLVPGDVSAIVDGFPDA